MYIRRVYVVLSLIYIYATSGQELTRERVARALPLSDVGLTGNILHSIVSPSLIKCLKVCIERNCSSFNFGNSQCELLDTFLCEGLESLTTRLGFKHYDVEKDDMIPIADQYIGEVDCLLNGFCSPKCYTTTTTVPPTTASTPTTPTSTTTPTTAVTSTTVTSAPSTVTTTSLLTSSTSPMTTTGVSPPGPGEVHYVCVIDSDCLAANSDCRNYVICECVAGYSYDPSTKQCVTTCPAGYGDTFTLTFGNYVYGHDISTTYVDITTCFNQCLAEPTCASIDYDNLLTTCYLSSATKIDYEYNWYEDFGFDYYQRNCQ